MAAQVRQANYTDYSNSYNEMLFVIRQRMAELQTALPVKVIAVKPNDGHTGFVDVQPLVQQISADSTVVDHGIIYNVPYFRIQGGINGIIIDPAVGDIGLCDFCSRDISAVKNSKQIAPPASRRMHSFSDAVYIGGFLNKVPTRFIKFGENGIEITPLSTLTVNGNIVTDANITCKTLTADHAIIGGKDIAQALSDIEQKQIALQKEFDDLKNSLDDKYIVQSFSNDRNDGNNPLS